MSMYKAQRLLAETMRNRRKQQREEQEQQQEQQQKHHHHHGSKLSDAHSFAENSSHQHRRVSHPANHSKPMAQTQGKQGQVREPLRQRSNNGQHQTQRRSVCQKLLQSTRNHTSSTLESVKDADEAVECGDGGGSNAATAVAEPRRLPCLNRMALLPADVPDVDQRSHCSMVSAYAKDIFVYLAEQELAYALPEDFLSGHAEITERSRAVLVDWLLQLCGRFELQSDTYHLSVRLLDHYLAVDLRLTKYQLQQLGAAALWLASKLEEVYCISLGDLLHVCAGACGRRDLLAMELRLVGALDFHLLPPLPITFLRRLSKVAGIDNRLHFIAKYLLELATLSVELSCRPSSQLAAAALRIAMGVDALDWSSQLAFYSGYTVKALQPVSAGMARALLRAAAVADSRHEQQHHHHHFVYQKYRSAKCLSVANCSQLQPDSPYLARLITDAESAISAHN